MTESETQETATTAATEPPVAEKPKSTRKAKTPKEPKAAKGKDTKKTKPPKVEMTAPQKVKKERAPKEDLVVFAFRLTEAERDAIHKAAGPRNATQFVRRVAVAFAAEDDAAFRGVLKEARQVRG